MENSNEIGSCNKDIQAVSNRKIAEKFPNTWKLNNTLLNNPYVKEEILRKNQNNTLN